MSIFKEIPHVVSVSEATRRGIQGLVHEAEQGEDIIGERHGKTVAAVVSVAHLETIRNLESDLRESVQHLSRLATDSGTRTDLNDVISAFGFNRAELEAELGADIAAGRFVAEQKE